MLGGEQSGHLIFRDHAVTGDGPLAGILLLEAMVRAGRAALRARRRRDEVPAGAAQRAGARARRARRGRRVLGRGARRSRPTLGDEGRVLVRPSGTEPVVRVMVEASDERRRPPTAGRARAALGPAAASQRRVSASPAPRGGTRTRTECVLAIDLGTSGPKVALVATSGAVVDSEYEPTRADPHRRRRRRAGPGRLVARDHHRDPADDGARHGRRRTG